MKKILVSAILFFSSITPGFGYFDEQVEFLPTIFEAFDEGYNFYEFMGKASTQDFTDEFYSAARYDDTQMLEYFEQLDLALNYKKSDPQWLEWLQNKLSPIIDSKLEKEILSLKDKKTLVLAGYLYIRCDILLSEVYYEENYTSYTQVDEGYSIMFPNNWEQYETHESHPDGPSFIAPSGVPMFGIMIDDSLEYTDNGETLVLFMETVKEFLEEAGMVYLDSGPVLIGGDSGIMAVYQVRPGIEAYVQQVYAIHNGKLYALTLGYSSSGDVEILDSTLATFEF